MENSSFRFAQFIHPDRFSGFLEAADQDSHIAERLYIWNIQVSAAFWGGFHFLEILLRNAIHAKFIEYAQTEEWWQTDLPIRQAERNAIHEAKVKVFKHQKFPSPGHVIAELSLGFWVGLFANNYHSTLWIGRLESLFPNYSGTRRELHADLEILRKLRNRIAHHESIYTRNLTRDFEILCSLIGFMDKDVADLVRSHSRVEAIIVGKDDEVSGTSKLSF